MWFIYPYSSEFLSRHWGHHMIASMPITESWYNLSISDYKDTHRGVYCQKWLRYDVPDCTRDGGWLHSVMFSKRGKFDSKLAYKKKILYLVMPFTALLYTVSHFVVNLIKSIISNVLAIYVWLNHSYDLKSVCKLEKTDLVTIGANNIIPMKLVISNARPCLTAPLINKTHYNLPLKFESFILAWYFKRFALISAKLLSSYPGINSLFKGLSDSWERGLGQICWLTCLLS